MATVKAVFQKQHLRADGKYPLEIRITNNRRSGYLGSGFYVKGSEDFNEAGNLKNRKLRNMVDQKILKIEVELQEKFGILSTVLGPRMADYLRNKQSGDINFINHFQGFIDQMIVDERKAVDNYKAAKNHLAAYMKEKKQYNLFITQVTVRYLSGFQKFLEEKTGKRGVSLTMSCIRKIFNDIKDEYNEEENDIIVVKHYPFDTIKIKQPQSRKKRYREVEDIREIIFADNLINKRDVLAQSVFTISFFLGGINLADLYLLSKRSVTRNLLEYNRQKVRDIREDEGYMCITVPEEIKKLMKRYADPENEKLFDFCRRYGQEKEFVRAVNKGLEHICKLLDIPKCTTYTARHSASYILNKYLRYPQSDVDLFLNHSSETPMAEIYTGRNFEIIDEMNQSLVKYMLYDVYTAGGKPKGKATNTKQKSLKMIKELV